MTGKFVAVAFIDFRKAFDSVPHATLIMKLERHFGIKGSTLAWLESYLTGRKQFTVLNGVKSDLLPVSMGIPQGSVLGPTLFTLFTNDLSPFVRSGSLYMFADDTTVFCIGNTADEAIVKLNRALQEVYDWCGGNQFTPHPGKTEAMLFCRGNPMGPIAPVFLGDSCIKWVTKARVLGLTVDHKLTWDAHLMDVKKSFANKLDLLKRSRFLPKSVLRDFYFKVILPSVKYGLVLWGACCNSNLRDSIERLHCRASRIIFNLPRDMPSIEVLAYDRWPTISFYYKIDIFKIFSKAHNESLPELLSNNIYTERRNGYSLRGGDCLSVPRFETRFMKDSLAYRGTVLWNTICLNENGISHLSNKDRNLIRTKDYFKNFKFDTTSASTTRNINADFMYN